MASPYGSDFYRRALGQTRSGGMKVPEQDYWFNQGGGAGLPSQRVSGVMPGFQGALQGALPTINLPDPPENNPNNPNPNPNPGNPLAAWSKFLELIGAMKHSNPEASGGWGEVDGRFYRKGIRGFDLYGLAPQEVYWENLTGSGQDRLEPNRIPVDRWWKDWQTPGDWGAHEDPRAPGSAKNWLKQELDALDKVWGQFDDPTQQIWVDRLLRGTGLPSYLQAFLKARPQWITDYISNRFKV